MAENKKKLQSGYGACRITNNDGIISIDFDPNGLDLDADKKREVSVKCLAVIK
ncbi:MAG TPA: hypothetical protein H9675_00260 [Firmicutes bacterium]|mgnify:FL=1|nr:hypothetical protein [Bacillota bacterium]